MLGVTFAESVPAIGAAIAVVGVIVNARISAKTARSQLAVDADKAEVAKLKQDCEGCLEDLRAERVERGQLQRDHNDALIRIGRLVQQVTDLGGTPL